MKKTILSVLIIIAIVMANAVNVVAECSSNGYDEVYNDGVITIMLYENISIRNDVFVACASTDIETELIFTVPYTISVTANVVYNDLSNSMNGNSFYGSFTNYSLISNRYYASNSISTSVSISEITNVNCLYGDCAMILDGSSAEGQISLYSYPYMITMNASRTSCLSAGIDF